MFYLPIYYETSKNQVSTSIYHELELTITYDDATKFIKKEESEEEKIEKIEEKEKIKEKEKIEKEKEKQEEEEEEKEKSIYTHFCGITDKTFLDKMAQYYTTNIEFLKDNQTLLKAFSKSKYKSQTKKNLNNESKICVSIAIKIWKTIKQDDQFMEKYLYVNWEPLLFLNKSSIFLLFMSLYNICSPLISLLFPIILLFLPFVILKIQQLPIDFSRYMIIVKELFSQHAIGKLLFTNFTKLNAQDCVYLILSTAFYFYSIYQNVALCRLYHTNLTNIHSYFRGLNIYTQHAIQTMTMYLDMTEHLVTDAHRKFNQNLLQQLEVLKMIHKKTNITDYVWTNITTKSTELGIIFQTFYLLYSTQAIDDALSYSFDFFNYMYALNNIQQNIRTKKVGLAKFNLTLNLQRDKIEKRINKISQNYYATHKNVSNVVKNDVYLSKNRIITGPNASGKTTLLKSILINTLLSQQWGCGFYKDYKFAPFDYLHCYLNIPDTSGRDSLFQAEARRCKNILTEIETNPDKTHLCIFDEIYSGTNPEDAVLSATRFLQFIAKNPNVTFLVSTHFIDICNYFENKKEKNKQDKDKDKQDKDKQDKQDKDNIINCHMRTLQNDIGELDFTYVLQEGISNIHGGLSILKHLNYPIAITEET